MATAKIIVVEKNKGEKIAYEVSGTKIIFGDDELIFYLLISVIPCTLH